MRSSETDHFNGKYFFNPEAAPQTGKRSRGGMMRLLKARMTRNPALWAQWPERIENKPYPAPDPATPSITWIGHSSFLVCFGGLTMLTDPVFSERCSPVRFAGPKRVRDPGLRIEQLPHIDLILLSHNHYDHMDIAALRQIRKRFPAAHLVTSLGNAAFLKRNQLPGATELDWWESVTVQGAHIAAAPARHFAARTLWDRNQTLWVSFMVNYHGHKLYFGGDSGYTKFYTEIHRRLGAPDMALLPIGAYAPREMMKSVHMNPEEAVQAFSDLQAKRAVGMHFGTFQLTAEPIDAPEKELTLALAQAGISPDRFFTLDVGQTAPLWG